MQTLAADFRQGVRLVLRTPGFALLCASTLGIGIGATAAMLGVVERLLWRGPEHVVEADHLRRVYLVARHEPAGVEVGSITGYATYTAVRDGTHSFAGVAAYQSSTWPVGIGAEAVRLPGVAASADFFALLGAHPAAGRFYTRAEDLPNASSDVVVLAYEYWMTAFASDPHVLGRRLTINLRPFTIIGVAPRGFTGVTLEPVDFWLPLSSGAHPRSDWPTTWAARWVQVVVRVPPGTSVDIASRDATAAYRRRYAGTDPAWRDASVSLLPVSYTSDGVEPPVAQVARWLTGVAIIVLLIGCANVGNLLLARGLRRRHELAIRVALGMSARRLAQLLLSEGFSIALASGAIGTAIAYGAGELIRRFFLADVVWTTSVIDFRMLLIVACATLSVAVLISVTPLVSTKHIQLADTLKSGVREGGASRGNARSALLLVQTTLTVLLLVGAGLFVRSLQKVRDENLGIQTDRVLAASIAWPPAALTTAPNDTSSRQWERQRWRQIRDSVAERPEFESASLAIGSPFRSAMSVPVRVPGWDSLPPLGGGGPYVIAVDPDYFRTVGTPILIGRGFLSNEGAATPRSVIINETMARTLWPRENPLGRCVIIGDEGRSCATIVGVVPEAHRFGIREEPAMQCYIPLGQERGIAGTTLLVRPRPHARAAVDALRRTLATMAPNARYIDIGALQDRVDPQIRPWRLGAAMFGLFGAIALLVAAAGLYSVVGYLVTERRHEFGVRLAIGASPRQILTLVLRQGLRLVVIGCAAALLIALSLGTHLESQLFDESARDPVVFIVVVGAMLVVATLACIVPAARSALLDPAATLRGE